MSEVAGRMSIQVGAATACRSRKAAAACCLGGVPGVPPSDVVILGGGMVGSNAAHAWRSASAPMSPSWTKTSIPCAAWWRNSARPSRPCISTRETVEALVLRADLVIGGVLIPGAAAPKLVTADMIRKMKPGSVVVDVAIDQGGCFETSQADDPCGSRPISSTRWCTTASPTCRAAWRAPRPSRSTT